MASKTALIYKIYRDSNGYANCVIACETMSAAQSSAVIQPTRCPLSKPVIIKHNSSKNVLPMGQAGNFNFTRISTKVDCIPCALRIKSGAIYIIDKLNNTEVVKGYFFMGRRRDRLNKRREKQKETRSANAPRKNKERARKAAQAAAATS